MLLHRHAGPPPLRNVKRVEQDTRAGLTRIHRLDIAEGRRCPTASCTNQRMSGAIFRHRVVKKEVERALYALTRWQLRRAREKIRYRNPQRCGCVDIPTRKVWTRRRATLAPDSRHIVAFHSSSTTSRAADSQFLRQLSVGSARRVNMCCPDRYILSALVPKQ